MGSIVVHRIITVVKCFYSEISLPNTDSADSAGSVDLADSDGSSDFWPRVEEVGTYRSAWHTGLVPLQVAQWHISV